MDDSSKELEKADWEANGGFSASPNGKQNSSGSHNNLSLKEAVGIVEKNKSSSKKTSGKKHGGKTIHSKSAPVSRQQTIVDEDENITYETQKTTTKPIFTKLETKKKRKRKVKGVFGSVTSASTAREKASQTSSEIGHGIKSNTKKKKKHKKWKKHKKSKKKKKEDKSILQYLKREAKTSESDTETDENEDFEDELTPFQMRRKMYRPHLGIPGQSFLRAELEDPITLVEEEFLPEGLQTLRLTRSQLAMNFLHNKPRILKPTENQSQKSLKMDESRSKSAQESIISQDLLSSVRSRVPSSSLTPNLLQIARLRPKYNSVRFTIPMDVRVLKNLKPHDYLINYCIPQSYFQNICSRVLENNEKIEFSNLIQFLIKTFTEIFGYAIPERNIDKIINLIGLDEKIKENVKLFTASAAILMRIECNESSSKEEKDKIEKMDFYLLRLNLKSFPIDLQTNKLLQFIDSI